MQTAHDALVADLDCTRRYDDTTPLDTLGHTFFDLDELRRHTTLLVDNLNTFGTRASNPLHRALLLLQCEDVDAGVLS
jgi:hypothetical protein